MRKSRNLIVLVIFAFMITGIYYFDSKKTSAKNMTETETSYNLLDISDKEISEIEINNMGEKMIFIKGADKWKLKYPDNIKYDQVIADGLHLSLGYLAASKVVAQSQKDLSSYGLDKPVSISVKSRDGSVKVLEIGNTTSSKEDYYARIAGSDKIYTIPAQKAEAILLTKIRVKDKNVLALAEYKKVGARGDDIKSLILERQGQKVLAVERDEDGSWNETFPEEKAMDASELSSALNAIVRVVALEFVDEDPDLSKYGLDEPSYGIEFEYVIDNKVLKKKLYIGDENKPNGEFFASVEGSKDVFVLDETGFDFLDKDWKDN